MATQPFGMPDFLWQQMQRQQTPAATTLTKSAVVKDDAYYINLLKVADARGTPAAVPTPTVYPAANGAVKPVVVGGQQITDNYGNADISTQIKNAISNGSDNSIIQGLAQGYENKINAGGANYAGVKIRTGADLLSSLNYKAPRVNPLITTETNTELVGGTGTGQGTGTTTGGGNVPAPYVSPYQEKILSFLDKYLNPAPAPVSTPYKSLFDEAANKATLDKYLNPTPFKFDPNSDPNYAIAQREGNRINQDQLGNMSSVTGGRLNSWATSSAAQAQNDFMGNALAQSENTAQNKYNADYANIGRQLEVLQGMDTQGYNRQQDSENTAYNRTVDARAETAKQLGMLQDMDTNEYNKFRNTQNDATNAANEVYNRGQDKIVNDRQVVQDAVAAQEIVKNDYIKTVGRFSDNYQAEINNVLGNSDPKDDWQADILGTLKKGKESDIKAKSEADAKALVVETAKEKKALDDATKAGNLATYNKYYKMYIDDGEITTQVQANVLGKKIGDKTSAQKNIDADNARMKNSGSGGGSSGSGGSSTKPLTLSQQSAANYNQFVSDASSASGEDIVNAFAVGESGLTKGTDEYNKALIFGQDKFYNELISKFNSGTKMYKDGFTYRLNQPKEGIPNYYKDLLGAANFNGLVSMATKANAAAAAKTKAAADKEDTWSKTYKK